jgi:3',5'-cyclic AMP phosphodiesterase CpdA
MRTIAHLSDLHFGTEVPEVAAALASELNARPPSLVVVSGDLTQRARRRQFGAAREYLARLPQPQVVVPGNHDVPLFDVARRFLSPLTRYRRFINHEVNPVFADDEMLVVALNTARSFTWKNGRISCEQIEHLRQQLEHGGDRVKIVVTHHPFIPPANDPGVELVGRAQQAIPLLDAGKVDLLLAGHLHHGYAGDIRSHYPAAHRSVIAVQAGTAISHRTRDDHNAYNWITVDRSTIGIQVREWQQGAFQTVTETAYVARADGWIPAPDAEPGPVRVR